LIRLWQKSTASHKEVSLSLPPILADKHPEAVSVFEPSALLRGARRQKRLAAAKVPSICVLDPDGDIVRHLQSSGAAKRINDWPCYHTDLYGFSLASRTCGIIGRAVGAPFAVMVAEELFASGCRLLISVTSAGQISPAANLPYFLVINRALRDEGTSYHYAAPEAFAQADPQLVHAAIHALKGSGLSAHVGPSWTTDAPFRETAEAITAARVRGLLAVEMEAAALYAFAQKRSEAVLCLAQVTNMMGLGDQDFEKGEAHGADAALTMLEVLVGNLLQ
jgi:uridine phosphorylase